MCKDLRFTLSPNTSFCHQLAAVDNAHAVIGRQWSRPIHMLCCVDIEDQELGGHPGQKKLCINTSYIQTLALDKEKRLWAVQHDCVGCRWRQCQLRRMKPVVLTLMRRPMPTGSCRTSRNQEKTKKRSTLLGIMTGASVSRSSPDWISRPKLTRSYTYG